MALTACYCELEDVATRLGIDDFQDDATLEAAVTSGSRAIRDWCGQDFYPASSATARTFRPFNAYMAKTDPFSTTTGLVIKTDDDDDGTYETTWSASDYELDRFGGDMADAIAAPYDRINGIERLFPTCTRRARTLQVTAQWGWAAIPQPVHEAAKILAVDLWKRKDVAFGIQTGTIEFGGLRIGRDVMAQVSSLLQPYRRMDRVMGIG